MYDDEALYLFGEKVATKLDRPPAPPPPPPTPEKSIHLPDDETYPTPHRAAKALNGYSATKNGQESKDIHAEGGYIGFELRSVIPFSGQRTMVDPRIARDVLGEEETYALTTYIRNYDAVLSRSSSQEYGMPSNNTGYKNGGGLPGSKRQMAAVNWLRYTHEKLPDAHIENLAKIVALFHAETKEISLEALGRRLTRMNCREAWEGGVIGYLVAVSQLLRDIDRSYHDRLAKKYIDRGQKIKYRPINAIAASKILKNF